jgi:hypothetical protein
MSSSSANAPGGFWSANPGVDAYFLLRRAQRRGFTPTPEKLVV